MEKSDTPSTSAQDFGLNFNMAMTMMKINNLDSAEKYLKKSLQNLENNDGSFKHELVGFDINKQKVNCYVNLALIYQKQQKVD